jgi:CubicO group peptidase (beta-lactamase class C family)
LRSIFALALLAVSLPTTAQQLTQDETLKIDAAVPAVLAKTGAPSVSVGVARGGSAVYAKAFGTAVLAQGATPAVPANATMAYPIGSISKQFTAAAILILQEQGKLKLDDPVSKWFPEFTRANEVTVRNLLTHTSGYSDYAPQDYTIPAWTKPIDSYKLIKTWATKPLDFDPGTKWQYSNTNFQMAALILEKVSGQKYHDFLWANVITPLKLQGVLDLDTDRSQLKVRGYEKHAMGPLRPAILEAPGWYSGDASFAMPVATLMAWDESIVHRTLLKPESYDAMETEFKLNDGSGSHYGLGVFVGTTPQGKHILYHSGEVGGFVSNNVVDLDDDVAYAALTNIEGPGASEVTSALRPILLPGTISAAKSAAGQPEQASLPKAPAFSNAPAAQTKAILSGLQSGKLDRKLFTADTNYYFNKETLGDFQTSLQPLGAIESVTQVDEELRGGMVFRVYTAKFASGSISINTYTQSDGKIEQFLVSAQ